MLKGMFPFCFLSLYFFTKNENIDLKAKFLLKNWTVSDPYFSYKAGRGV